MQDAIRHSLPGARRRARLAPNRSRQLAPHAVETSAPPSVASAPDAGVATYGADRGSSAVGIAIVVLLHVALVYALVTGLAKKVVEVVRAPIETQVIEEVRKTPPPPEIVLPPPKLEAPPPPFIPPPEVRIATPPPPQPTITATTPVPPPAPVEITPAAPAVVAAPPAPAPAVAAPVSIGVACPTMVAPVTPRRAEQDGISGVVKARATIKGGQVVDVEILSAKPRGVFDEAVRTAMLQYGCQTPAGQEVKADQTFNFKTGD